MKVIKTAAIGLTLLGGCVLGAKLNNEIQNERMNKQFWQETFIEKYAPEKYQQLKDVPTDDYKTWQQAYDEVQDSLVAASNASKAYFDASKNISDSINTQRAN